MVSSSRPSPTEPRANLIIGPENITGTLKGSSKQAFKTVRVDDPGLVKELDERKIRLFGTIRK